MSDERFAADPEWLGKRAQRLLSLQGRVRDLTTVVEQLASRYPEAAGDGEFRESYDTNYVPAADSARSFMDELSTSVAEVADGTATVSKTFADTEDAAVREGRHQA